MDQPQKKQTNGIYMCMYVYVYVSHFQHILTGTLCCPWSPLVLHGSFIPLCSLPGQLSAKYCWRTPSNSTAPLQIPCLGVLQDCRCPAFLLLTSSCSAAVTSLPILHCWSP